MCILLTDTKQYKLQGHLQIDKGQFYEKKIIVNIFNKICRRYNGVLL